MTRITTVRTRATTAAIALLLVGGVEATAQESTGAKALFYNPQSASAAAPPGTPRPAPGTTAAPRSRKPSSPGRPVSPTPSAATHPIGVRYWIEHLGVGPVTEATTFRTGDRIRLHAQTNAPGYLTLWSVDRQGRSQLLLPPARHEGSDGAGANPTYDSPVLTFTAPAADERLVLSFSRTKPGVDAQAPTAGARALSLSRAPTPSGARALAVEVETANQSEVGTYVVNKDGGAVVAEIRLRHQVR
jgi:hypothetical protein